VHYKRALYVLADTDATRAPPASRAAWLSRRRVRRGRRSLLPLRPPVSLADRESHATWLVGTRRPGARRAALDEADRPARDRARRVQRGRRADDPRLRQWRSERDVRRSQRRVQRRRQDPRLRWPQHRRGRPGDADSPDTRRLAEPLRVELLRSEL